MSKIAKYLSGHIIGEVSARETRLKQFAGDRSILRVEPSLVVFPRVAEDVRKMMRFAWQLAEKNHTFGVVARGYGGSTDGSSISSGILLDLSRHMRNVRELDIPSKTVRVQAGANFKELNTTLGAQAMTILQSPAGERLTVGGAIAMNLPSEKFNYGELIDSVNSLEVILANGEIIQTGRITRRELNSKLAFQSFEGEIYRQIDALIEENEELIGREIANDASYGYSGITRVKRSDGSFDLTPLFFGSLGTLGVITEAVFKTDFIVDETGFSVISFASRDDARDFIDTIRQYNPNILEMFDGKMFEAAVGSGKKYEFYIDRIREKFPTKMVLVVGVSDRNQRKINSTLKKIEKMSKRFEQTSVWRPDFEDEFQQAELESIRDVREALRARGGIIKEEIYPIQGVYVPLERFEAFYLGLQKIALKHNIPAPIQGSALTSIFEILAEFDFSKVSDRQKSLRFLIDLRELLASVDGEFGFGAGEGRLYGGFVRADLNPAVVELFDNIRKIFDPQNILNPEAKKPIEPKEIVKIVRHGK